MNKDKIKKLIRGFEDEVRVVEDKNTGRFYIEESEVVNLLNSIKYELKEKTHIVITSTGYEEATSIGEARMIKEMYSVLGRNAVIKPIETVKRGA